MSRGGEIGKTARTIWVSSRPVGVEATFLKPERASADNSPMLAEPVDRTGQHWPIPGWFAEPWSRGLFQARAWLPGPFWRRSRFLFLLTSALLSFMVSAWSPERLLDAAARIGGNAPAGARALADLLASLGGSEDETRLGAVNQFFNRRILFRDDTLVWGQIDYWASPLETLAKGMGDCEDYAIAKYFSLVALGVAPVKLRLVYVRATIGGAGGPQQAHMVLAYYSTPGADPLVLDNLITEIRPASRRVDLTPVFSFNAEGLWQGPANTPAGDPTVRLSKWREVLLKAREQGFE